MPEKIEDEVVDFSNFTNSAAQTPKQNQEPISPIQSLPNNPIIVPKKILVMVGILILLSVVQLIIFLMSRPRKVKVPEGYQIVKPVNGPIRMEKVP